MLFLGLNPGFMHAREVSMSHTFRHKFSLECKEKSCSRDEVIRFSFLLYRMAYWVCVTVEMSTWPPLPFFLCSLFLLIFSHHLLTYYTCNSFLIDEYEHVVNVIASYCQENRLKER